MRACKIIATLGPQAQTFDTLRALALAGADAFRINLSYDNTEIHDQHIRTLRALEADLDRPLCLIADISGPRFRIGPFADTRIALEPGQVLRLDQDEAPGDAYRVHLPVPEAFSASSIGDLLRLDDGRVVLRVTATSPVALTCTVVAGTELSSGKIISLPKVTPRRDELSLRDHAQVSWARAAGVDWVAVPWPTDPGVWQEMRDLAGPTKIMTKMESRSCLADADAAIAASDGLVIARADMGYDFPAEEIPGWQKRLTRLARRAGKPVVVAAQMLESMVTSPAPTRAEASDVANAVKDGADALMLSAETAVGAYVEDAVAMMASIITTTEADQRPTVYGVDVAPTIANTIARAAAQAADALQAPLIFCFTSSGSTALSVTRTRPRTTIICASDNVQTLRQMQVIWGLKCLAAPALTSWLDIVETAGRLAKTEGIAPGQPLVITAGMPFGTSGSTNILRIVTAE